MVDGESVWRVHLCKTTRVHIRGNVVVDGESVWRVHLCKTTHVHIRGDAASFLIINIMFLGSPYH